MITLSPDEARTFLVGHLGLRSRREGGAAGIPQLLRDLRHIQLDPLDPMGTNADLVVMARLHHVDRGEVYAHAYAEGFEHYAKERCLLPAEAFPHYRAQARRTPAWRATSRLQRITPSVLDAVEAEVRAKGPSTSKSLADHGSVEPLDWSGWKSTSRATSMALEVLTLQCRLVICGRSASGKIYDVPERALGPVEEPARAFAPWALRERVDAAGLLGRASGPCWSMLRDARGAVTDRLVARGELLNVQIAGSPRKYLVAPGMLEARFEPDDGAMRILGPLDPLLWDRRLVRDAFGFDYVWEVYKPAAQRRWAWYVMPLLHEGRLVGRLAGRVDGTTLVIDHLWRERTLDLDALDMDALDLALEDHAVACQCDHFVRPLRAETKS